MNYIKHAALVIAIAGTCVVPSQAQTYEPTRPIEFVVHTGPGGGNDVLARRIAQIADQEKLLPVRLQVVNKPGGGSLTALAYIAENQGNPNMIAAMANTFITAPLTRAEARVTWKDVTPIALLATEPALVVVKGDSKYKTLKDLVETARKNPGKVKQSGGSPMSRDAIVRAMIQKVSGAEWPFISFPGGGERIAAVLGGHVDFMTIEVQEAGEHLRNGNLRPIAAIAEKRLPGYPNVPTLKEAGFNVPNYVIFRGIVGPPGMPPEAVTYYENFFERLVATPGWKKYVEDSYFNPDFRKSAGFAKFIEEFVAEVRPILTNAGVKVHR